MITVTVDWKTVKACYKMKYNHKRENWLMKVAQIKLAYTKIELKMNESQLTSTKNRSP